MAKKMILLSFSLLLIAFNSKAFFTDQNADIVVGQPNMTSYQANQGNSCTGNSLCYPYSVYSDGTKLLISDTSNHRVLLFNTIPEVNNSVADIVIGQEDMWSNMINQGGGCNARTLYSPRGIYYDDSKLIIADTGNSRVLIFNAIPNTHNAEADIVVGQKDMWGSLSNRGMSCNADALNNPHDVFSDGTKLIIGDTMNHRMLIFNSMPNTHGAMADVVIGQINMTSNSENQGGVCSANGLYWPCAISMNSSKLLISDVGNNRVLIYNSIPNVSNTPADIVFGQQDMWSHTPGCNANAIGRSYGLTALGDNIIISDYSNNRVLILNAMPNTHNASADIVLGQINMAASNPNQGADTLCVANSLFNPHDIFAINNKLFVSDLNNNRILIYYSEPFIKSVSPNSAYVGEKIKLIISGYGFSSDSTIKLIKGPVTISGTNIDFQNLQLTTDFDLQIYPGIYDVVVENPNGTCCLENAFTVENKLASTPTVEPGVYFKILNSKINPIRDERAIIRWLQAENGPVTIRIYNLKGERIATLTDGLTYPKYQYNNITWYGRNQDGSIVSSGIYIVHIQTPHYENRGKISVIK